MNGNNAKRIAVIGLTAAVYVVATLALPFLSYGNIQCRFSEVMNLLVFINPIFAPGLIIGCFISNIFSPNGIIDIFFGTFATACSVFAISKTKNLFVATLWPVFFNGIIIGIEIFIVTGAPYLISKLLFYISTVAVGEFVAVTVVGYVLFGVLLKNKGLINILKSV